MGSAEVEMEVGYPGLLLSRIAAEYVKAVLASLCKHSTSDSEFSPVAFAFRGAQGGFFSRGCTSGHLS